MNKVYLGLGSNVGDRIENIRSVVKELQTSKRFTNLCFSSLYESKPYGKVEQNSFINGVVSFYTDLSLQELFIYTKELEKRIGRIIRETWGPREIDIDILLYDDLIYSDQKITVPHKDLLNRDFVLVPLLELDENIIHPLEKKEIKIFLSELNDKYITSKINFSLSRKIITKLY